MSNLDDEFEFKPLTEGLGFHKKTIDLHDYPEPAPKKTPAPAAPLFSPSLQNKTIIEPQVSRPVSQNYARPVAKPLTSTPISRPQAQVQPQQKQQLQQKTKPTFGALEASATSWPAAIFDSTMVLGLVLIFSAAIFAVTRIDLTSLIDMLQSEPTAQFSAVLLVISVYGMYTVVCRVFFGKTLGDSVFYYQLGTPQDQESIFYPLKVFLRSMFIATTGFVLLPLLSTILKKDVPGILSGVSLYTEKK